MDCYKCEFAEHIFPESVDFNFYDTGHAVAFKASVLCNGIIDMFPLLFFEDELEAKCPKMEKILKQYHRSK